jgi:hypothetical protein
MEESLNDEEIAADAAITDTFQKIMYRSSPKIFKLAFNKLRRYVEVKISALTCLKCVNFVLILASHWQTQNSFLVQFFTFIVTFQDRILEPCVAGTILASMCKSCVAVQPKMALEFFVPHFCNKINRQATFNI